MCGIAGVITRTQRQASPLGADEPPYALARAKRMAAAMRHRGPDDEDTWMPRPGVALAHVRLAILDLSPRGRQPMRSEDGRYGLVYNGELYNFRELRAELASAHGCRFRSDTDSEVVLHALIEWGEAALLRFNGMFALALWDEAEGRLLLARDHAGIKPLYLRTEPSLASALDAGEPVVADAVHELAFASEAKALDDGGGALSREGLANFLAFGHAVGDTTLLAGVRKVPPGWLVRWHNGRLERARWDRGCLAGTDGPDPFDSGETRPAATYGAACRQLRRLLHDAVERQTVADVPLGLFLSGGVDSSGLTALAARQLGAERTHTFSLGFRGVGSAYDETPDATAVAEHLGTNHHVLYADESDLLGALDDLVYHYDEPFADAAGLAVLLLSRLTRRHVTVCLSGEGADELFGGYRRYVSEAMVTGHPVWRRALAVSPLPSIVMRLRRLRRLKTLARAVRIAEPAARYASYLTLFDAPARDELTTDAWRPPAFDPVDAFRRSDPGRRPTPHGGPIARLCLLDQRLWLVDTYLEKADKASMAASLEVRVPFLDRRVLAFANALPDRWRIRRGSKKRILRDALRDCLPPAVLDKPKRGFAVPIDRWFRGALADVVRDELLARDARSADYVQQAAVRRWIDEHQGGRADHASQLWALFVLERWLRRRSTTATGA